MLVCHCRKGQEGSQLETNRNILGCIMAGEMLIELSTSTIFVSPSGPIKLNSWLFARASGARLTITGCSTHRWGIGTGTRTRSGLAISNSGLVFCDPAAFDGICSLRTVMENRASSLGQNKLPRNWVKKLVQFISAIEIIEASDQGTCLSIFLPFDFSLSSKMRRWCLGIHLHQQAACAADIHRTHQNVEITWTLERFYVCTDTPPAKHEATKGIRRTPWRWPMEAALGYSLHWPMSSSQLQYDGNTLKHIKTRCNCNCSIL